MTTETVDLSKTIAAKSDQLNSEDLIGGPITGRVVSVTNGSTVEQPVAITLDCWPQPWRPCKTMRRLLVAAWGKDGSSYVGRAVTLYRDPAVKWAGESVGGIRVKALSHIEKPLEISLAETRKNKKRYLIEVLKASQPAATQQQAEHPLKHAFEQMKDSWKQARAARGETVTADDLRVFVSEATSGRVGMSDALIVSKYAPADIDACSDAVVALREAL